MSTPPQEQQDQDLAAFIDALSVEEGEVPLLRAALLITSIQYPDQGPEWWRHWEDLFDQMVGQARLDLPSDPGQDPEFVQDFIFHFFTKTLGFHGDRDSYHSPENSCLPQVITRRCGLPITLSVLLLCLAKALRFPMYGVSTPGHFLVGVDLPSGPCYSDPFNGTIRMTQDDAAEFIAGQVGCPQESVYPYLRPTTTHAIITRMLNNLKVTYSGQGDLPRLVRTITWMLALEPDNLVEYRNRGLLLLHLGETRRGATDLMKYVEGSPDAEDIDVIRQEALQALSRRSKLN